MLNENFIIVGAVLNLIGGFSYLLQTVKGQVKPNRVTWLMWSLVPIIVFIAQIEQGVGLPILTTFITGFIPLMIFLGSFINKKAYWKLGILDIFCGILSLLGILLWYITKTGNLAIFFSILADTLAATPTIIKSFKAPETEDYKVYMLAVVAAALTLLTLRDWDFSYYGWSAYMLILNSLLTILIKFKLGKKVHRLN